LKEQGIVFMGARKTKPVMHVNSDQNVVILRL